MPWGQMDFHAPRGLEASRLRQRKATLRRRFQLPQSLEGMLPGSLSLSHFRCGKSNCHCAEGEGHPTWSLAYTMKGKRRVLYIPPDWVDAIREQVETGRAFQDAVREVLGANAELLALTRKQRRR